MISLSSVMNNEEQMERLKQLYAESEMIRQRLGISAPNTVIFHAPRNAFDEEQIIVEADGLGGATLSAIEGNYPIDFQCLRETRFATEAAALEAADHLINVAA
jgi:hypothetical protein